MGKQVSVLRIKGSVGEVTGYKLNTSSKTSKSGDFIRSKATSVANPRTYSQAKQRAKARPAQLFYEAFSNVENHAFFPLGKPIKNRNRFLSHAMKLDYVPDVKKGEVKLPFAPYQVSEGTLGLDTLCVGSYLPGNDTVVAFENLPYLESIEPTTTVAEFTSALIESNPRLQNGQELTFLTLCCNPDRPSERWADIRSIILDEADSVTKISDIFSSQVVLEIGADVVQLDSSADDLMKILAAALIISSKTASSWLYTNSYMALSAYAIDGFDWKEREIIESYMNEARDRNSDKTLQQADNTPEGEMVPVISVLNAEVTLKQGVVGTLNQTDAAIAGMRVGGKRVVVSDGGQLQWYNGQTKAWTGITLTNQGVQRNATIADTTWDGSPTITIAECQANGF